MQPVERMQGLLRNERNSKKVEEPEAMIDALFQNAMEWSHRRIEEGHGMACRKSVLPKIKGTTRSKARQATTPVGACSFLTASLRL